MPNNIMKCLTIPVKKKVKRFGFVKHSLSGNASQQFSVLPRKPVPGPSCQLLARLSCCFFQTLRDYRLSPCIVHWNIILKENPEQSRLFLSQMVQRNTSSLYNATWCKQTQKSRDYTTFLRKSRISVLMPSYPVNQECMQWIWLVSVTFWFESLKKKKKKIWSTVGG